MIQTIFRDAIPITTHNDNSQVYDAFMVGADGDLNIETGAGNLRTIPVVAGVIYPIATKRIRTTGTTATGIVGLSR